LMIFNRNRGPLSVLYSMIFIIFLETLCLLLLSRICAKIIETI